MDIAAMFEGQGWFAIVGQIVLIFTATWNIMAYI